MKVSSLKRFFTAAAIKTNANITNEFNDFVLESTRILTDAAPVDSGDFKNLWRSNINGSTATISNSSPYASAIEFGSVMGQLPWPSPGPKTVSHEGRVFSSQAPGGTINKVFTDEKVNAFANDIAKSIISVFR